jgi:hypothetical protein
LADLADSVVVVPVCATATRTADDVDVAYKLLVGVKTAVMLSLPCNKELVMQVAVPTPGEPAVPDPVTVVA